jgi:peptidoglycan/LPS O-acetylase OafA/YrhL
MRLVFGNFDAWGEDVRRVVLYREDAIAFGFMLYLSVDRFRIRPSLRATAAKSIGPVLLLLVTIALSALAAWAIAVDRSLTAEILFPYLAGALGCAAVFAAFRYAMVFQETPRLRNFCLFSGRVSYSIYLLHLIVALLLQPSIADLPIILQLSIFVVVLLIICSLYYRYFEKPILAARPAYSAAGNR